MSGLSRYEWTWGSINNWIFFLEVISFKAFKELIEFLRASFLDWPGLVTPGNIKILGILASTQKSATVDKSFLLSS